MSSNKAPQNNVFYRNQNWDYPKIERGEGIYLYDENGKKYIDGCSGSSVANIGHGNREVAEATKNQVEKIAFTHLSRFTTDEIENCCEKIASWAPGDLNHVYLVSGGSESTETAIKMARQYFVERDGINCSKSKVISRWNSFHGNTMGSLSMTGISGRRRIYEPMLIDFPKINQAYKYRCPYPNVSEEEGDLLCANELEMEILRHGAQNIAAFIAEPVIGSAAPGVNPTKVYFKRIREICDKYDVLFIADEVMSGFGRTGEKFAINHYDVIPDIITCAKGMSCGYSPLGACIVNDKIFKTIMIDGSGEFVHGHTYGGNPLSAEVANTVMNIIERENYVQNCKIQGEYLLGKLQELYNYEIVGDIRGKGLMIGIEFVKDRDTKEPFEVKEKIKTRITKNCLEEGLVVYPGGGSVDGVRGDHILLAPPINIRRDEVDELYKRLKRGIEKTTEQLKELGKFKITQNIKNVDKNDYTEKLSMIEELQI